jgi:hypothetical protein
MPGEAPRAAIGILLIGAGTWLLLLLSSSIQQPHEGGACSSATPTLAELFEQRMKHDRRRILVQLQDKAHVRTVAGNNNVSTTQAYYLGSECSAAAAQVSRSAPADFAYKASHTAGCVLLVREGVAVAHKTCFGEPSRVGARVTTCATPGPNRTAESSGSSLLRIRCAQAHAARAVRGLDGARVLRARVGLLEGAPMPCLSPRRHLASISPSRTSTASRRQIPRAVLAEELLPPPTPDLVGADDLKCWAANGRGLYLQHVTARFGVDGTEARAGLFGADRKHDTGYERGAASPRLDIGQRGLLGLRTSWPERNASRWLGAQTLARGFGACDAIARASGIDFARIDLLLTSPAPAIAASERAVAAPGAAAATATPPEPRLVLGEVTIYPMAGNPGLSPRSVDAQLSSAWCDAGGPPHRPELELLEAPVPNGRRAASRTRPRA